MGRNMEADIRNKYAAEILLVALDGRDVKTGLRKPSMDECLRLVSSIAPTLRDVDLIDPITQIAVAWEHAEMAKLGLSPTFPSFRAVELLYKRSQARERRDYDTADSIRGEIEALGYQVADQPATTTSKAYEI